MTEITDTGLPAIITDAELDAIDIHQGNPVTKRLAKALRASRRERYRLKAINAELLAALEYYADQDIVIGHIIEGKIVASDDHGHRARAAIAKAKPVKA